MALSAVPYIVLDPVNATTVRHGHSVPLEGLQVSKVDVYTASDTKQNMIWPYQGIHCLLPV